ncbi:glycosyl hydrolase [Hymenobacter guriensis]|uniref:Discoidin domain-containing protein n=1 Tax=Hymenobacter guriensis TaxID=2793065 RepID=A0ABS0L1Z3_9BACT|nr:glycosyl hydrolase [Hymenobacter guriensis]MBG8553439.1 discoidin domain-containing protein [Hymenobacter guriensis]
MFNLKLCGAMALLLLAGTQALAQTSFKSLNYLYSNAGQRTVAGQHNREPNSSPAVQTNRIYSITGQYPGLWSGDFLFASSDVSNRWTMINEAKAQWASGAIINLMWHACPPTQPEPCQWEGGVKSYLNDTQWNELITNGTQLNNNWKARLDVIATYLQDLENNGVEVYFRPLHEMNQGIFWWAGRPGANGTRRLFQLTRDYLRNTKGLTNLIWVWDLQDFSSLSSDLTNYNPGSSYWDVLALDMYYTDGQGYTTAKYNAMVNASGGKPIAIGECEVLPSAGLLAQQPRWGFFMGWAELVFNTNSNSNTSIQNTYFASNVLVRGEMPGWGGALPTAPNLAYNRPVTVSSSENTTNTGSKAVDANGTTRWASTAANNQNIMVDLGATYNINRVRLAWEAAYARDYQVQVSTNGTTWTTIKDVWGKGSAAADDHTSLNAQARYVKVYCINRATSYGFSLFEFEVYGTAAGARALATSTARNLAETPLQVYPNPVTDQLTMRLAPGWESSQVTLFDSQGRQVLREQVAGLSHQLRLSVLPVGMYQLLLNNGRQQVVQRFTKR